MSKKKSQNSHNNGYKPKPPFISVEGIKSLAWDKLSRDAVWALTEFYRKFNGKNRTNLSLTYEEVKGKISNGTFNNAIWELIGYGFIRVRRFGRLNQNASIYELCDKWEYLSNHPEKLDRNEKHLARLKRTKRIPTPKKLNPTKSFNFRAKRRQLIRVIQNKISAA